MVGSAFLRDRGEYHRALAVRLVRHAQAATLVTALVIAAAALLDTGAEPLRLVAASLIGFLAVAGWDVRQHRTRTTERPLRVLGLGAGEEAARLARAFDKREAHGVELVGFVGNLSHAVVPVMGELAELPEIVRRHDIDAIVLTASRHRLPLLEHLLGVGDRTPAVLELSDLYERAFGCVPVEEINAAWFIEALTLHRRLQASVARRSVDIVVATVAAVVTAPLMLLVALAIKLDSPGPVFYRQVRVGEGGRRFTIIKFRSMRTDAEASGTAAVGVRARPAHHARRSVHPPLPHRRAPAALERRARRDGARRAPPGAPRAGRRDRPPAALLRAAPPRPPRHHGLGSGVRALRSVHRGDAREIVLRPLLRQAPVVRHRRRNHAQHLGSHGRRTWGPLAAENREKGRVFMRTTRFILPLVALALCVMPAVALASNGGTTQAIVKDVAKDGKVDGHYTNAQLKAALKSPLLKQYGGQGAVESVITHVKPKATAKPATGVAHNLPFTGSDVFLFVGVGGGLLAAGLVLRRFGRRDDEASA